MTEKLLTKIDVISRCLLWRAAEVSLSLIVTFAVGCKAVRYAYQQRGYRAVGGECFLIILTAYVSYKVFHIIFCLWRSGNAKKRKKRRSAGASWL